MSERVTGRFGTTFPQQIAWKYWNYEERSFIAPLNAAVRPTWSIAGGELL